MLKITIYRIINDGDLYSCLNNYLSLREYMIDFSYSLGFDSIIIYVSIMIIIRYIYSHKSHPVMFIIVYLFWHCYSTNIKTFINVNTVKFSSDLSCPYFITFVRKFNIIFVCNAGIYWKSTRGSRQSGGARKPKASRQYGRWIKKRLHCR